MLTCRLHVTFFISFFIILFGISILNPEDKRIVIIWFLFFFLPQFLWCFSCFQLLAIILSYSCSVISYDNVDTKPISSNVYFGAVLHSECYFRIYFHNYEISIIHLSWVEICWNLIFGFTFRLLFLCFFFFSRLKVIFSLFLLIFHVLSPNSL